MRVPSPMLAAIAVLACLLCAYSAVGEDGDTSFCDTLDGMMNSTISWDEELRVGRYTVLSAMQPTKPPGAVRCVAYAYTYSLSDDDVQYSTLYTCQWSSSNPRSTFVDFGTRLHACLEKQGYSSRPSVDDGPFIGEDQGERFYRYWVGKWPEIHLAAYKMSGKGVFLRVRYAGIDDYQGKRERLERYLDEHSKALVYFQTCVDREELALKYPGQHDACSDYRKEGKHIYSSKNPYRGSLGSVLANVNEEILMARFKPEDIRQLRDISEDIRQERLRREEAGKLWINGGRNPGEIPD